ncbi:MAG: adenylate/guanylate cyclase domain-containing protein [Planctomycetota bacterium]
MLEIAVLHPSAARFEQRVISERGIVLLADPPAWKLIDPPADGLNGPWLELRHLKGQLRVRTDASRKLSPTRLNGDRIPERQWIEAPALLAVADWLIEFGEPAELARRPMTALERRQAPRESALEPALGSGPAPATLTRWFEAIATLSRWSTGDEEFWRTAAQMVVDPIGFDAAYVLRREPEATKPVWRVVAARIGNPKQGLRCDTRTLASLATSPVAWFDNTPQPDGTASACAPWFAADGELAGAVLGVRRVYEGNERRGVRHLETNLVRLVAETITSGVARREQEASAARRRGLIELAFSRPVAERIERDADLLRGQSREVSVLFADLREFSRRFHTQAEGGLGAVVAYELLGEVMDALSDVIAEHNGHLIDYYGDGLAAMWNAPLDQPEHTLLAARSAIACDAALAPIDAAWRNRLGEPLRLGVGVHTGRALVGNVGSRLRIKYGARGETVNLAARVERATKAIGISPIVTSAVATRLEAIGAAEFRTQRLCRARLAGIEQATDLYALSPGGTPPVLGVDSEVYAAALASFEADRLEAAKRSLRDAPPGTPAAFLAARVQAAKDARRGRRAGDHSKPFSPIVSLVEA